MGRDDWYLSQGKSLTVPRVADGKPINSSLQDQVLVRWILGSRSHSWVVDVLAAGDADIWVQVEAWLDSCFYTTNSSYLPIPILRIVIYSIACSK